jgi:hypothetical protein
VRTPDGRVHSGDVSVLAAARTGVCTDDATLACVTDRDCRGGACFVPPGGCIASASNAGSGGDCDPRLQNSCCPLDENDGFTACAAAEGLFCEPVPGAPLGGRCRRALQSGGAPKSCRSDADCGGAARCNDGAETIQRLVAPLSDVASSEPTGAKVFASAGRCLEPVGPL